MHPLLPLTLCPLPLFPLSSCPLAHPTAPYPKKSPHLSFRGFGLFGLLQSFEVMLHPDGAGLSARSSLIAVSAGLDDAVRYKTIRPLAEICFLPTPT